MDKVLVNWCMILALYRKKIEVMSHESWESQNNANLRMPSVQKRDPWHHGRHVNQKKGRRFFPEVIALPSLKIGIP